MGERALLIITLIVAACSTDPVSGQQPSEVFVLGMIHGRHLDSTLYGIDTIQEIVRAIEPDYLLSEIPPDRLERALGEFQATGKVEEPRVKRFPEYADAIFPLTRELGFEIVPCAGWTATMAKERREKLARWRTERAAESRVVEAAQARASELLRRLGIDEDPRGIHSRRYDAIVKEGMAPYDLLFNEDLGPGGWSNINAAHYALIEKALDTHRGRGKRFLITFGSWHKYSFLERLEKRDDIRLRRLEELWDPRRTRPVMIFADLDGTWRGSFAGYDPHGRELYRIEVEQTYTFADDHTQRVTMREIRPDATGLTAEGENTARRRPDGTWELRCVVRKSNGEVSDHSGRLIRGVDGDEQIVWSTVRPDRSETFRESIRREQAGAIYEIQGMGRYGDSLILMHGRYRKQ